MIAERYPLAFRAYPYARHPDQDRATPAHHSVVVVGAGPVGLALALDLGLRGVPVLVLDDHEGVGMGSRAICFSKRSLEILDRLGAVGPVAEKGVVWNLGKVFHRERMIYDFNLLAEDGHRFPAFVNLQQPYFEKALLDRIFALQAQGLPVQIRGKTRVEAVHPDADGVTLDALTPDGPYRLRADWVVACDGASSPIRTQLGLPFQGQVFKDSFLIADVRMHADFPTERWFWFDPPSGAGASQLLHKQPDDVWRIDFQIGWDVDRAEELRPENVRKRVRAMLGEGVDFDLVWTSIYTFQCRRMTSFTHGRVLFAGDAAHQVSPFGARGANSGLQDAENLAWKLARVVQGASPVDLLASYDSERIPAADENILNSTRSTDFITPKSQISRVFRDAVLDLAAQHDFARPFVNSGRLSVPAIYDGSPLNTPDALPGGPDRARPGSPCPDAPLDGGYLLDRIGRDQGFKLLALNGAAPTIPGTTPLSLTAAPGSALAARYLGAADRALYLIRPDQHVAARWHGADPQTIATALTRATGTAHA